eukprot:g15806.t1
MSALDYHVLDPGPRGPTANIWYRVAPHTARLVAAMLLSLGGWLHLRPGSSAGRSSAAHFPRLYSSEDSAAGKKAKALDQPFYPKHGVEPVMARPGQAGWQHFGSGGDQDRFGLAGLPGYTREEDRQLRCLFCYGPLAGVLADSADLLTGAELDLDLVPQQLSTLSGQQHTATFAHFPGNPQHGHETIGFFLPGGGGSSEAELVWDTAAVPEARVYGARLDMYWDGTVDVESGDSARPFLATPTGHPADSVDGKLLCWALSDVSDKLFAADLFHGYSPESPSHGLLRRGVVRVVVRNGTAIPAHWYYLASADSYEFWDEKEEEEKEEEYEGEHGEEEITDGEILYYLPANIAAGAGIDFHMPTKPARGARARRAAKVLESYDEWEARVTRERMYKLRLMEDGLYEKYDMWEDKLRRKRKIFKCTMCAQAFSRRYMLTEHTRIHTKEKPYGCPYCDSAFTQLSHWSRHVKIHTGERPHQCTVCGRAFASSGELHAHVRTHTGEKPFVCETCGDAFSQLATLNRHKLVHSEVKPWVCPVCNHAFRTKADLTNHNRTHTGERPYACSQCEKAFKRADELSRHMRVHSEKKYNCSFCGQTFTQGGSLNRHMRTYHPDEWREKQDADAVLLEQERLKKEKKAERLRKDMAKKQKELEQESIQRTLVLKHLEAEDKALRSKRKAKSSTQTKSNNRNKNKTSDNSNNKKNKDDDDDKKNKENKVNKEKKEKKEKKKKKEKKTANNKDDDEKKPAKKTISVFEYFRGSGKQEQDGTGKGSGR